MRESTIERAVCAYAKSQGCIVMKLSGNNQKGQPDRMFIKDGRVLFLEFKAPGKNPTALQRRWLSRLRCENVAADWCDKADDGISMILAHLLIQ